MRRSQVAEDSECAIHPCDTEAGECHIVRIRPLVGLESMFSRLLQTDYQIPINPNSRGWHSPSSSHFPANASAARRQRIGISHWRLLGSHGHLGAF